MKNKTVGIATVICLFFIFSCKKDELKFQEEASWVQINVPEARAIYSFSGNIENELIVGGSYAIRKTSNQGAIWSLSKDSITAYELRKRQDTLFAIALYNSSYSDYYSIDNGNIWKLQVSKSLEDLRSNTVTSSNGTIYKIVDPGTYPKQPDQVLKSVDGGNTWEDTFPYKRYIYSIYLDENDGLYIGASHWEWNVNTNSFDNKNSGDDKGVIYYLKE